MSGPMYFNPTPEQIAEAQSSTCRMQAELNQAHEARRQAQTELADMKEMY